MLDFWASGADGVTVRLVIDFVVVFRMAGGLPSLARVATGEEDRNVFIVAVVASAGGALWMRGCRRVSLASMGAAAALRRGSLCRVPPGLALRGIGFGGPLGAQRAPGWAPKGFLRPRAPVSQRTAAGCGEAALPFFL